MTVATVVVGWILSCSSPQRASDRRELYQRVGAMAGLQPIIDELVWRLATDEMTAMAMSQLDYDKLKSELLLYLCEKTAGPCLNSGNRPLIHFDGSPSGVAKRMLELVDASARARGFDEELTRELVAALEPEVRAMIGPRAGSP